MFGNKTAQCKRIPLKLQEANNQIFISVGVEKY